MLLGIRWGSLRAKIIAWSFVPAALILAAVAWLTFVSYQQVTEDLVIERNQQLVRSWAGGLSAQLAGYATLLTEYAGVLANLPPSAYAYEGDVIVQGDVLSRARSRLALFDGGVVVLDNQGTVVAAEPKRPEIMRQSWADRPYFRQMLRSTGAVFSDVVADGSGWAQVIVIAVPIKGDQGQFLGVIAGMFRLSTDAISPFYSDIARPLGWPSDAPPEWGRSESALRARGGQGGSVYLIDSKGSVIYHSDSQRIGDDFSAQAAAQQVLAGRVGALRTRDLLGQEIVASFSPVAGTSWGLIGEEAWSALVSGSRGYQRFLLLLLVLGVAVPAIVVAVGTRRITRPIGDLIAAAQRVAEGQFDAEEVSAAIAARTGDEIEELADQFSLMAAQLQASYAHLEQRVADRTKELAALNAISAVVSQTLDLDEILNDALDKTLEVMGIEAGGIYLLDADSGVLHMNVHRGLGDGLVGEIDGLELGEGFSGRVVESGEPLVVQNIFVDPRLARLEAQEGDAYALVSVPVSSKGRALGALFIVAPDVRQFTEHDVQFLSSIGHQIGIAVENAQHLIQAEQRMQELEALYRADERMHRHLRLDEVLQALVDVAVDILRADKSTVLTWDEEEEGWTAAVARGFRPETMARLSFAREEGVMGQVVTSGRLVTVEDSLTDPRRAWERAETLQAIDAEGIRSFMHLPIQLDNELFGVFNVAFVRPHAFGRGEERLFSSLAQRAALAIDNARLYEQTEELAVVEERSRLARELHDAVTQTLFSASLIAEILPELWASDPDEGRQLLQELQQLSRGALAEMRTLLLELRPAALVEASLENLLRQLAEAVSGREGVPVKVTIEGQCQLSPDVHVALYRIAQEALNNVVKHAQASQVAVSLRCAPLLSPSALQASQAGNPMPAPSRWAGRDPMPMGRGEQVELTICDDGRGFDPDVVPAGCLGLGIIRERAQAIGAALEIDTKPGCGTQIRIVCVLQTAPVADDTPMARSI
jgi:nitrate/nitrite-specific signal transduction histidine kinase